MTSRSASKTSNVRVVPEARASLLAPAFALLLFGGMSSAAPPQQDTAVTRATEIFFAGALGRGLRFNNPFRLRTQLGDDAESLSLTAPYLDLTLGAAFGSTTGLQHGGALVASLALEGVSQEVLSPSYVALLKLPPRWMVLGRAGLPIVIEPDANLGFELGGSGVFLLTAGAGLTAELVASLFQGAGTPEVAITRIPLLSFELGIWLSYEVL